MFFCVVVFVGPRINIKKELHSPPNISYIHAYWLHIPLYEFQYICSTSIWIMAVYVFVIGMCYFFRLYNYGDTKEIADENRCVRIGKLDCVKYAEFIDVNLSFTTENYDLITCVQRKKQEGNGSFFHWFNVSSACGYHKQIRFYAVRFSCVV